MYDPKNLGEESLGILDELVKHHRLKLSLFEQRRELRRIKGNIDGKYSLTRLLNAQRNFRVEQDAPLEHNFSQKIAERLGREPRNGFEFVPISSPQFSRDLTAGVGSAGGYLISDEVAPGDTFVGALHASSVAVQMGISKLRLEGSGSFPSITGKILTYWLPSEGTQLTESQFSFVVAAATPKNLGCYLEMSDQFLKQTTQAGQNFVLGEMGRALGAELDSKIIDGDGASGRVLGILNTVGVGSVPGASLGWAGVLDAVEDVEENNGIVVPERSGWVVSPGVARLLRAREKIVDTGQFIMSGNSLADYRGLPTNSVPAAMLLFGDWSSILLLEWGSLEISTDPYGTNSSLFTKGLVGVRAIYTIDVIVLRPKSFSKITSIT